MQTKNENSDNAGPKRYGNRVRDIVHICEVVVEDDGMVCLYVVGSFGKSQHLQIVFGAIVFHLSYADLQCRFSCADARDRERASSPLRCIRRIYENGAEAVGYILHMYLCNWKFNRNVYGSEVKLKCRWVEYKPTQARAHGHTTSHYLDWHWVEPSRVSEWSTCWTELKQLVFKIEIQITLDYSH